MCSQALVISSPNGVSHNINISAAKAWNKESSCTLNWAHMRFLSGLNVLDGKQEDVCKYTFVTDGKYAASTKKY